MTLDLTHAWQDWYTTRRRQWQLSGITHAHGYFELSAVGAHDARVAVVTNERSPGVACVHVRRFSPWLHTEQH